MEGQQVIDENDKEFGKKHDDGKPRMELLSPIALEEIAKVLTFGAKKYGDHNWRQGIKWTRILGALLRHVYAFLRGENEDSETGLSHMAHVGCCVLFLLDYEVNKREFDDRYKPVQYDENGFFVD